MQDMCNSCHPLSAQEMLPVWEALVYISYSCLFETAKYKTTWQTIWQTRSLIALCMHLLLSHHPPYNTSVCPDIPYDDAICGDQCNWVQVLHNICLRFEHHVSACAFEARCCCLPRYPVNELLGNLQSNDERISSTSYI